MIKPKDKPNVFMLKQYDSMTILSYTKILFEFYN